MLRDEFAKLRCMHRSLSLQIYTNEDLSHLAPMLLYRVCDKCGISRICAEDCEMCEPCRVRIAQESSRRRFEWILVGVSLLGMTLITIGNTILTKILGG